ncbi:MAG: electron transfer flavoprotein subunit beta/FixA family protein [Acidimicrobiia bacterium]|nr:electron transfer flavoprotein subunit beta/FixA family protein [Acidimicrobiia bacterium]
MNVLVCVKRVPAPGARIPLTDDGQEIDARNLGFAISPHEECAVEEAVRIAEATGGEVTVLTLGPSEAEEQLRNAVAVGADRGVLVETDENEWDPQATAAALGSAIETIEGESGAFDLVLFGNDSADGGNFQVGIRVARRLNRPVINGIKGLELGTTDLRAKRETDHGFEVFGLPLPAVVGVKEGINLPRYPTLPGRMKARKAEITRLTEIPEAGGLRMRRLVHPPEQGSTMVLLGEGASAAGRIVDVLEELGFAS